MTEMTEIRAATPRIIPKIDIMEKKEKIPLPFLPERYL